MRITLGKKLFLYTSCTVLVLLLATFLVLERSQSRQWEEYLKSQNISFARFATPELLKMFRGNFSPQGQAGPRAVFDFLGFNRDLVRFTLLSPAGRELYESPRFPDHIDLELGAVGSPELRPADLVSRLTTRTLALPEGGRVLEVINPAFGPTGEHLLSVRFLVSYDSVDDRLAEIRHQFLRLGVAAILLSLALVALVSRRVTSPLKEMTSAARSVARGDLQTRIPFASSDEIGSLARAFNEMAASLAANREELTEKNDALVNANRELVGMQQQLVRSERLAAIGQLAAGVSHEIDNPVGIILGYAELLFDELPEADEKRSDVQAIIDECKRCRRITGGLLSLARSSTGERATVEMNQLLNNVFESLRPQKLFRRIELKLISPARALEISADPGQLRQIFVNLLINAGQAMEGGPGVIEVDLKPSKGGVGVLVRDSGPGFSPENRERVFDPFYTTKFRDEGTGLGLTMCRQLIGDHGGTIVAENSPGGGGQVRIFLPC